MKPKKEEDSLEIAKEKVQGDSDQEMMNLDNELYSLTHYADDEEELVAQMFATIKGSKLEAMMPPILKEIPLIDVQQLCLHELRGMSQRRILSIINGQEMSGSSSDEDSDENKKSTKFQDDNEDSNLGARSLDEGGEGENPSDNLTAMDILELEMRAKLIKTMLEKQDGDGNTPDGFDPNIKIKEEPLSSESAQSIDDSKSSKSRRRKRYSRRRRSGSSSYSSSRSSSGSRSRSRSYSSERKKEGSESPGSKKPSKKKITKKEFVARMKKAKQNRSYRKRKDSEDDSGEKLKKGRGKKVKEKVVKETESIDNTQAPKDKSLSPDLEDKETEKEKKIDEEKEEGEEGEEIVEEGEEIEKEEGELDSHEEGAYSSNSSRSRSYTSSYSSYSSRSYSRSPRRKKKSKRKSKSRKSRRRYRSRSPSVSDTPKVPNWPGETAAVEPISNNTEKNTNKTAVEAVDLEKQIEEDKNLPSKEERQSISFSFNKKAPIITNPELNDDAMPGQTPNDDLSTTNSPKDVEMEEVPSEKEEEPAGDGLTRTAEPSNKANEEKVKGETEISEDFYKGADQLDFSEEEGEARECDDEAIEKFIHDDTPVEPIGIEEDAPKITQKEKENLPQEDSVEMEDKNDSESAQFAVDSTLVELDDTQKEDEEASRGESVQDTGEESLQETLEPIPESEVPQETHSLDIIGVIDPKEAEGAQESYDALAGGSSSWSMRWLQSEKVQKVVSNSKMLSKVRKNIQAKGKEIVKVKPPATVAKPPLLEAKQDPPKSEAKPVKKTSGVIGSIDEYEKMFGIKVKAPTSLPQPKPASKPATPQATSQSMGLLDSDEDEDSEEEALWSKIIKK